MPELPEVETVRRGLTPAMVGHRFVRVEQRRPDLRMPFPERFAERLTGRSVDALDRRAKYLLARLDDGNVLVMHLGMSGRMTVSDGAGAGGIVGEYVHDTGALAAHDHVVMVLSGGATVTYNDPRRFGFMVMVAEADLETHPLIRDIGPEPLGNAFNAEHLARRAAGRSADLKAFLLDQKTVAGLGNIYVAEALFRAGLSPGRAASCLADAKGRPTQRAERLVPAIRQVLEDAIAAGGSTLRDYQQADGSLGYFQHSFQVYGREGEPCLKAGCRGIVRRKSQAGRSTFACTVCQR